MRLVRPVLLAPRSLSSTKSDVMINTTNTTAKATDIGEGPTPRYGHASREVSQRQARPLAQLAVSSAITADKCAPKAMPPNVKGMCPSRPGRDGRDGTIAIEEAWAKGTKIAKQM